MSRDSIPAELLFRKGLTITHLRLYSVLDHLDVWNTGVVQVSHRRLGAMFGVKPATIAAHLRRLRAADAIEVLYGGAFRPGAVAGDANTYRLIHKVPAPDRKRRDEHRADGATNSAPSRRDARRAISSPTENPAPTRRDGFHPYPCFCETCEAQIEAKVDHEGPCPPSV